MKPTFYTIILSLILTSCSTLNSSSNSSGHYIINVDAFGTDATLLDKKYVLIPVDTSIDQSDLKYIEYKNYVDKVLNKKGYVPEEILGNPSVVIFMNYGVSDPQIFDRDIIVPVWGQVGVASSTTTINRNGYGGITGNTSNTPSYGVVGSNVVKQQQISYLRYFTLAAYDLKYYKETGKEKKLWILETTSTGSSDDLRKIIPPMLIASMDFIGKSSGEKKQILIRTDDPRLIQLKEN